MGKRPENEEKSINTVFLATHLSINDLRVVIRRSAQKKENLKMTLFDGACRHNNQKCKQKFSRTHWRFRMKSTKFRVNEWFAFEIAFESTIRRDDQWNARHVVLQCQQVLLMLFPFKKQKNATREKICRRSFRCLKSYLNSDWRSQ